MTSRKSLLFGMVFAILMFFGCTTHSLTVAAATNGSVSDCLNDQSKCSQLDDTGAKEEADREIEPASVSVSAWDYIKVFLTLIVVVALLIMVLKFINKKNLNYQQNSIVRNIGGLSVGQQKSVQILQIGERLYLVGVGEEVNLLKEISDPQEIEQLLTQYNNKQTAISTKPYIFELLSKKKQAEEPKVDFNNEFQKRIAEIKNKRTEEIEKLKGKEKERDE